MDDKESNASSSVRRFLQLARKFQSGDWYIKLFNQRLKKQIGWVSRLKNGLKRIMWWKG